MANELKLDNPLARDMKPVKVNDKSTGLLISDSNVFVESQPTEENHVATKKYVDDNAGGGSVALNDLTDVAYSSGDLTISSLDKIIADDFVVDSGASVELDAHNGNFVAKKAGIEFSVANSAYAGTILGYRLIGESHTHTSYTMTNSFAVPDSDMTVRFIAPPSGNVEYEVQAYLDVASNLSAYFGLSDNATYNTVGATYEHLVHKPDESDQNTVTWKVVETGLTAGSTYNRWFGAKVSSGTTSKIFYGGTATNRYADFIFKVTALPTAVSDFAVYD